MKAIAMALLIGSITHLHAAPVSLHDEPPASIKKLAEGHYLVDFNRVSFANLRLTAPEGATGGVTVHFGEALEKGRINRKPPGTVRYATAAVDSTSLRGTVVAPPPVERHFSHDSAIRTPKEWGVILPFRWVEIEGWNGTLKPEQITRRSAYLSSWDDSAASFTCSDPLLNRIWELCRYSIKATTFAGVYVDGDRERIPYEADAYINQLCHYYTDNDKQMARDTFDQLMRKPTWPTEWAPHMVFMAHADWMHTGGSEWLLPRYESLKSKLLTERAGADGLIRSNAAQMKKDDIVDWPKAERDGYVFKEINTVVNAFHLAALQRMADLARAVGKADDAKAFQERFEATLAEFQRRLIIPGKGVFRDGVGTDHVSLHANLFPLAFGLVPEKNIESVVDCIEAKGMACSVYAAQYLLEGLFLHGGEETALKLITAEGDRSWKHMVESGTTITWEAWDMKYKPNQDWNHAWGAAPGNALPRFVLGVEPASPGWTSARIKPHPGDLSEAKGTVPTVKGPVAVSWTNQGGFKMDIALPEGMNASISLPAPAGSKGVFAGDVAVPASRASGRWILEKPVSGKISLTVR